MKRTILLLMILALGVGLVGCSGQKLEAKGNMNVKFTVGYQNTNLYDNYFKIDFYQGVINNIDSFGVRYKFIIINSEKEIQNLTGEEVEYLKKYDSNYFEEKFLIILNCLMPTRGGKVTVSKIVKNNDKLLIQTDVKLGIADTLSWGVIVIEVSKKECKNINNIEIIK